MGLIFITHDMGVVAEMADRVLVMRDGVKVEEGDAVRIFDGATTPVYTNVAECGAGAWEPCRRGAAGTVSGRGQCDTATGHGAIGPAAGA